MKPTKEQLDVLGLRTDEYLSEFYDKENCYYTCLKDALWCGIFGFCTCGNPDYEIERIIHVLEILKNRTDEAYAELCEESNGYQIYLYLLDERGFTEHGFSIYGSWLTPKGEALYVALKYELEMLKE